MRHRATAMGVASMGQGLGALVMVPMTQYLISEIGWRNTFMITASLILVLIVPANALLQRRRPEEVDQFPDGGNVPAADPIGSHGSSRNPGSSRQWTLSSAAASFPFWSIIIGHLGLGTALFMINTHLVAHLVSRGLDKLLAAFVFGLIGFMRIGGTLIWGFASDRLGRDLAYAIATGIVLLGLGCVIAIPVGSPMWFVYLAAVIYSIGYSAGNPTYGAVIADIFSGRRIGFIFGFLEVSFGLGSALGAWLGGFLFDVTGSYRWPFAFCLLCFAVSALAIHACIKWQNRQSGGRVSSNS
ncbi:MAG: MFS transporter [Alphaproteobacteria bacterium]